MSLGAAGVSVVVSLVARRWWFGAPAWLGQGVRADQVVDSGPPGHLIAGLVLSALVLVAVAVVVSMLMRRRRRRPHVD